MSNELALSNMENVTPINLDDSVKNKLFVVVEGDESQFDYLNLDLDFNSTEKEIMDKIVPIILEKNGINISDTYKVRKTIENENIFIIPNSVAG